ncbi:DUF6438 domain-containing protein [Halpernia frigidisoli]|uniref:DUF6438 domain-containing protein n=1 Tax=Halpernia frigidisoli TaxID=1125876 RepID=A0A1I3E7H6_9FLAO|nr:DUF6438 domain-containing protein [Halpernia frigidisoli]SFH94947.1 hypothetical protein SAMN05443292_0919 [Halpernia frigidisoli]
MKYLIAFTAAFLLFSCAPKNQSKYSKIEYSAGACYGFCPIFKVTINSDRTAIIEAESNTFTKSNTKGGSGDSREGTFKTVLKEADYNNLVMLINQLNVSSLKNKYGNQNVTDLPTSTLAITMIGGNTKTIEDYGKRGTPELRKVYDVMEALPKTQNWIKISN